MVKILLGFLLCALSLWFTPAGIALPQAYLPALSTAAQDSTGTVWAMPVNNSGDADNNGKVYRWQAGAWAAQAVPGASGFRPLALTRGNDGAVYVFWQKGTWQDGTQSPPLCLVTMHRGGSRFLAQYAAAVALTSPFPSTPTIYVGGRSDVWVEGDQQVLWHLAPDGSFEKFPLKPTQVFASQFFPGFSGPSLGSTTDALGRRWFWQDGLNGWTPGRLRGFLIWDGKTLAYHATLPGLPDQRFSVVTPQDPQHFWVAEAADSYPLPNKSRGGLYQIDTKTLTAIPVTLPAAEAFQSIGRVFRIRGDLCVLEVSYLHLPYATLWRRHGTWQEEPAGFAASQASYGSQEPQAVLATPQGTWLGRNGAGLDWMPRSGDAVISVDWRRGVSAGRVSSLFRLTTGAVLAFCGQDLGFYGQDRSAVLPPLPPPLLPSRPEVSTRELGQPGAPGEMLADQRRHLWGVKYGDALPPVLAEWDGRQWHDHPLPNIKSSNQNANLYACDTLGRLWLTFTVWNPPAQAQPVEGRLVYDPAGDTWTHYKTVPEALAAAARPGMGFLPFRNFANSPLFSSAGHVAYMDDNNALSFYDGVWRHWKNSDIQPGFPYSNAPDGPRFNQAGHLEVNLDDHAFEWTRETGWQPNGNAKRASTVPALPPGGPQGYWGQPTQDNQGGEWIVWNSAIYLTRHGLWRKQAALSGLGSPFFDGRSLQSVLEDPTGRFFLQTISGGTLEYVIWTPPAAALPPAPRIQLTPLSAYSVRLRFAAKAARPHWFQWRLNGGAWSGPITTDAVRLTALAPGNYRVEAQAINTLLESSPTPSAAVFVLQPPTAAQVARWVRALLSGTDDEREAAVVGLVKQPETARAALEAARPGASRSARWWIDAALQQVEEQQDEQAQAGT